MTRYLKTQQGVSLGGLLVGVVILGFCILLGMKVLPIFSEYSSIKETIVKAKESGNTVRAIQSAFDKQAGPAYIESIAGKDLIIERTDSGMEVRFEYQKKIALFGPVSLLFELKGSTAESQKE